MATAPPSSCCDHPVVISITLVKEMKTKVDWLRLEHGLRNDPGYICAHWDDEHWSAMASYSSWHDAWAAMEKPRGGELGKNAAEGLKFAWTDRLPHAPRTDNLYRGCKSGTGDEIRFFDCKALMGVQQRIMMDLQLCGCHPETREAFGEAHTRRMESAVKEAREAEAAVFEQAMAEHEALGRVSEETQVVLDRAAVGVAQALARLARVEIEDAPAHERAALERRGEQLIDEFLRVEAQIIRRSIEGRMAYGKN
ncbi:hypothetical protein HDU96_001122 [Phlyctochytrium bullatum]|nr:hypothetical protein HDU96_001122 [Phlyctochytrium bullatum]